MVSNNAHLPLRWAGLWGQQLLGVSARAEKEQTAALSRPWKKASETQRPNQPHPAQAVQPQAGSLTSLSPQPPLQRGDAHTSMAEVELGLVGVGCVSRPPLLSPHCTSSGIRGYEETLPASPPLTVLSLGENKQVGYGKGQ